MLELSGPELEEIADALADQTDYEHRWLLDPRSGAHLPRCRVPVVS